MRSNLTSESVPNRTIDEFPTDDKNQPPNWSFEEDDAVSNQGKQLSQTAHSAALGQQAIDVVNAALPTAANQERKTER